MKDGGMESLRRKCGQMRWWEGRPQDETMTRHRSATGSSRSSTRSRCFQNIGRHSVLELVAVTYQLPDNCRLQHWNQGYCWHLGDICSRCWDGNQHMIRHANPAKHKKFQSIDSHSQPSSTHLKYRSLNSATSLTSPSTHQFILTAHPNRPITEHLSASLQPTLNLRFFRPLPAEPPLVELLATHAATRWVPKLSTPRPCQVYGLE